MKTLLLKLAGPLQSWGTDSRFENRYTDRYPSKSGVIGLIAASMGLKRENGSISQLNKLDFAVRIDQPGEILRDYHIARKFKSSGDHERTYVTNRYYLQDAVFVVGIASSDDEWICEIADSLKNPYFQPFLGRRSNPLTADFYLGIFNGGLIENLTKLDWQAADWYMKKNTGIESLELIFDADLIEGQKLPMARDRVITFSQAHRQYGFRPLKRGQVKLVNKAVQLEHDAFMGF